MLERFGYAFNELDSGKRQPATEEEQLFVAVCRGEREAATEQEKYGLNIWRAHVARRNSILCPAVNRRLTQ